MNGTARTQNNLRTMAPPFIQGNALALPTLVIPAAITDPDLHHCTFN
jgi:hypothetical protein